MWQIRANLMFLAVAVMASWPLQSQPVNGVVAAGYAWPSVIPVAPGQLVTLFAWGVGGNLTQRVSADRIPLPTTLAGISVLLKQTQGNDVPVPMLAVEPGPWGRFVALTVQIPFELVPNRPGAAIIPNSAALIVSEDGVSGAQTDLSPESDQIHVLNACDVLVRSGPTCSPVVTHADGSLVTADHPAQANESLVMYAVGLGPTEPRISSGAASPRGIVAGAVLGFDFGVNAPPRNPCYPLKLDGQCSGTRPQFAGLTAGFVGLYQVNFVVPAVPGGTPPCGGFVISNLTVSVGSSASHDGAGICVASGE